MAGIIKRKKTEKFTTISNEILNKTDISWKAKGLHTFIMSKPNNWNLTMEYLITQGPEGRDSVRAGFAELIEAGYAKKEKVKDESGKFAGWDYTVFETLKDADIQPTSEKPTSEKPTSENPTSEKPKSVKPTSENPPLLNTEYN